MPDVYRVVLSKAAYNALKVEAMVRHGGLKDTLESMVLCNLSQSAKDVLNIIEAKRSIASAASEKRARKKNLSPLEATRSRGKQLPKIETRLEIAAKVCELASEGKGPTEIGKIVGYPKSTVANFLKRHRSA